MQERILHGLVQDSSPAGALLWPKQYWPSRKYSLFVLPCPSHSQGRQHPTFFGDGDGDLLIAFHPCRGGGGWVLVVYHSGEGWGRGGRDSTSHFLCLSSLPGSVLIETLPSPPSLPPFALNTHTQCGPPMDHFWVACWENPSHQEVLLGTKAGWPLLDHFQSCWRPPLGRCASGLLVFIPGSFPWLPGLCTYRIFL